MDFKYYKHIEEPPAPILEDSELSLYEQKLKQLMQHKPKSSNSKSIKKQIYDKITNPIIQKKTLLNLLQMDMKHTPNLTIDHDLLRGSGKRTPKRTPKKSKRTPKRTPKKSKRTPKSKPKRTPKSKSKRTPKSKPKRTPKKYKSNKRK